VSHKYHIYTITFLPQIVLAVALFLEKVTPVYTGLGGPYLRLLKMLDAIKSPFQKNIGKKVAIPLLAGMLFISMAAAGSLGRLYENRDMDPNLIKAELAGTGINDHDIILADSTYWLPLIENDYFCYYTIRHRMARGEQFDAILGELAPTIILYDRIWRTGNDGARNSSATENGEIEQEFIDATDAFITSECTLLKIINNTLVPYAPVYVYRTNFTTP
nr:hypothetical protein [Candidatus Sigynarchaeota archaeon]